MDPSRTDLPMRAVFGDEELAIAWLAENGILPVKNRWGRYTLREPAGHSALTKGEKLLIVGTLEIGSDADLESVQHQVRSHPRWDESAEG